MPYTTNHFKNKALDIFPDQIPVEDSMGLIDGWFREAVKIIKAETGRTVSKLSLDSRFCDTEWIWNCPNPDDDQDDTDFIDLDIAAVQLDLIVEETINDIREDEETETPAQRYFRDAEGNLYTLDTLGFEYASFMETLPEDDDTYKGMSFEEWIDEWFLSGFDTDEISEAEYKLFSKKI